MKTNLRTHRVAGCGGRPFSHSNRKRPSRFLPTSPCRRACHSEHHTFKPGSKLLTGIEILFRRIPLQPRIRTSTTTIGARWTCPMTGASKAVLKQTIRPVTMEDITPLASVGTARHSTLLRIADIPKPPSISKGFT